MEVNVAGPVSESNAIGIGLLDFNLAHPGANQLKSNSNCQEITTDESNANTVNYCRSIIIVASLSMS